MKVKCAMFVVICSYIVSQDMKKKEKKKKKKSLDKNI